MKRLLLSVYPLLATVPYLIVPASPVTNGKEIIVFKEAENNPLPNGTVIHYGELSVIEL
jgi:hypothetical protein